MERKRYLELCQKYAMGCDTKVRFNDIKYHPKAYELSFDDTGKSVHRAILQDIKANAIVYASLKDVKEDLK